MPAVQRPRFYLAEWIAFRDLTNEEVAGRSGLSKTHVIQLKSGKRRWNEGVLLKLAEGLGLASPLDLFRDPAQYESADAILDRIPQSMRGTAMRTLKAFAEPERLDYPAETPARPRRKRRPK